MFEAQSHQPSASLSSKSATITKQTLSSAPVIAAPQVSFGAVNTKLVKNAEVNNSQAMMDNIYDEYEEPSIKGSSVLTKRRKNAAESQLSGINEDLLVQSDDGDVVAHASSKGKRKKAFKWDHNYERLLILKFKEAIDRKMVDPNSQTMNSWDDFVNQLWNNSSGLPTLEASSAKARWNDVLKKRYKAWRLVCEWSGAGGDGISELTEQAWQEIEQKHPECLQFKSAPFEFAKEMDECLQRKVASFTAAVTSTELVGHLNGKPTTTKPLYRTKKNAEAEATLKLMMTSLTTSQSMSRCQKHLKKWEHFSKTNPTLFKTRGLQLIIRPLRWNYSQS